MKKNVVYRDVGDLSNNAERLCNHDILEKIYLSRGITHREELENGLRNLEPFSKLKDIDKAVNRLELALEQQQKIVVIGDYDTDGATSTAIAVRALRSLGAKHINYLVPNRFDYGYGLSPEIVELAQQIYQPDLLITVDNGIVSLAGVELANQLGIDVIITDHHLAGEKLPAAVAVVNPNQPGDDFPSKALAGCGVIFYVMLALRAALREKNWFVKQAISEPNMANLLDILALGTVADVVPLDKNNRILVHQGVQRIRQGQCVPGIKALLEIGKRKLQRIVAADLAFAVAPRLNAAGRLEDMSLGVECLLADDQVTATKLAFQLDTLNHERREIEAEMKTQAFNDLRKIQLNSKAVDKAVCLYDASWHQGVIGILASRIKDHYHCPTIIFAKGNDGEIKGSARSIHGFHIRDCFERIALRCPQLIKKFGGHAMAAGLTIEQQDFETFKQVLLEDVDQHLDDEILERKIICDSELRSEDFNLKFAGLLRDSGPWGQGFPEPLFGNHFKVVEQRLVADKHLKLLLGFNNQLIDAIFFNADTNVWPNHRCERVLAVYRLDINEYKGRESLQLMIDYLEPV